MEIHAEETYFQEGDHVRIKRTREIGRVSATDGGLVYVLMDQTHMCRMCSQGTHRASNGIKRVASCSLREDIFN